jgi:stress response protein YsnF
LIAYTLIDELGTRATIEMLDEHEARVRLEDGQVLIVPRSALVEQEDGTYRLPFSLARFQQDDVMVVPVVQEEVSVGKREFERTVRITKTVGSQDVTVDESLKREDIEIEHVAINRYVEDELPVRYEGNTTIIPLIEEVLVVEKRLLLREELRITRRQTTVSNPQVYTLRREDISVERGDEHTKS